MRTGNFYGRVWKPTPALLFNTLVSAGLLFGLSIVVRAGRYRVTRLERDVFELINGLPSFLQPPLVGLMQLGSYVTVFVAAAVALVLKRRRLSLELFVAGNVAYYLALGAKVFVARPRPAGLLQLVTLREFVSGPFGYPSGHMAVATALGFTVTRAVPRRLRHFVWWAVVIVGFARIYVGAHLPVDIVGGFLVGSLAYCLTQLAIGQQRPSASLAHIEAMLAGKGVRTTELNYLAGDARGSVPLRARTTAGDELFLKLTSNEQRDADFLYKLYRRLVYRKIEDEVPFFTAKQKSEHEAYLLLRAERAGVRTPGLLTTATDEDGNTLLVQEFINGATLDRAGEETLRQGALADTWEQLAALHRAEIAHRDLRANNVLVRDSSAYLVDFGFAEENPSEGVRARDIVELLVATAYSTDTAAAVAAARQAIGCKALSTSLPYLQWTPLSRAGRKAAQQRPGLLDQLRTEIVRQCHTEMVRPAKLFRLTRRRLFFLVTLGLAVYFLLPQIGEVGIAARHIVDANPFWLICSALASAATYLASTLQFRFATQVRLPAKPTFLVQVANSFANRLAPGSLGGVALSIRFLQKHGVPAVAASVIVAIIRLAGLIGSLALVPLLVGTARWQHLFNPARNGLVVLLTVIGLLLLIAAFLAIPKLRHRGRSIIRQAVDTLHSLIASRRAPQLVVTSIALTVAYGACLYFALLAVGTSTNFSDALIASIVGQALGSAAPTPGGVGATEAAAVSALLLAGVAPEAAIAGVLIYRLMSFWFPIAPGFFAFRWLAKHGEF